LFILSLFYFAAEYLRSYSRDEAAKELAPELVEGDT